MAADPIRTTHLSTFVPQDPVTYQVNEGDDLNPSEEWAVYSERDQAERDRLMAMDLRAEHNARMLEFTHRFNGARDFFQSMLSEMERTIKAARANSRWDYTAPIDGGPSQADLDELAINRVSLEAQQFYSSHTIDRWVWESMTAEAKLSLQETVTGDLHHRLTATVYGHRHQDIKKRAEEKVVVTVPATWWQMFRRDVLKKSWRGKDITNTVKIAMSATPFSMFPELPYKAPGEWGPRIDLMLPRSSRSWIEGPSRG